MILYGPVPIDSPRPVRSRTSILRELLPIRLVRMEAKIVRLIIVLPILPHGPIRLVRMVRKTLARSNLIHHPHEADGVFLKKVAPTNSLIFASIRASRMGATRSVENSGSSHHCGSLSR